MWATGQTGVFTPYRRGTERRFSRSSPAALSRSPSEAARLPWIEARPGVRQKRIWEDKLNERRALLARFEPGATLPRHRHVGDELIFILEGANADESGVVATGNVSYRPNGCVHSVTTKNGATVLAVVWGRTEPV